MTQETGQSRYILTRQKWYLPVLTVRFEMNRSASVAVVQLRLGATLSILPEILIIVFDILCNEADSEGDDYLADQNVVFRIQYLNKPRCLKKSLPSLSGLKGIDPFELVVLAYKNVHFRTLRRSTGKG